MVLDDHRACSAKPCRGYAAAREQAMEDFKRQWLALALAALAHCV